MNNETNNLMPEKWVNLEEIAEHLAVSKDTIRAWIKKAQYLLVEQENSINLKFQKLTSGYEKEELMVTNDKFDYAIKQIIL